jgi:hypothetical protein
MIQDLNPGWQQGAGPALWTFGNDAYVQGTDSVHGSELFKLEDLYPPHALGAAAELETGRRLRFSFSEDVFASLGPEDFSIQNLGTGDAVTNFSLSSAAGGTEAVLTFSSLADGNYRAMLLPGSVSDPSGNPLAGGGASVDFFILAGDANHDRTVDTLDFNALAANFGKSGATFSQADFNYDGVVDTLDFNTLAAQFGKTLSGADRLAEHATLGASPFSRALVFADPRRLVSLIDVVN